MAVQAGLCDTCTHQRIVRNTRGSEFSLCERAKTDPSYPRYPRLPVKRCEGHDPGGSRLGGPGGAGSA